MNSSYYKNCVVPYCTSSTIKTPNKLFIYVPNNKKRIKWLKLAGRNDAHCLSTNSRMYFCEDHFDLPKDMANYMQYHLMGKVSVIRMNPESMPTKFDCQGDIQAETAGSSDEECKKEDAEQSHVSTESTVLMKEEANGNSASEQMYAAYVVEVELLEGVCVQPADVVFANASAPNSEITNNRHVVTPSLTTRKRPSLNGRPRRIAHCRRKKERIKSRGKLYSSKVCK